MRVTDKPHFQPPSPFCLVSSEPQMSSFISQDTYLGLEKSKCDNFIISYSLKPAKTQPSRTYSLFLYLSLSKKPQTQNQASLFVVELAKAVKKGQN
jgi:hypothetical protein